MSPEAKGGASMLGSGITKLGAAGAMDAALDSTCTYVKTDTAPLMLALWVALLAIIAVVILSTMLCAVVLVDTYDDDRISFLRSARWMPSHRKLEIGATSAPRLEHRPPRMRELAWPMNPRKK